MKTDNTQLVDAKTLAEITNLPVASVRRLAREGKLPHYKLGRLLRFDVDEVKAALKVVKTGESIGRSG